MRKKRFNITGLCVPERHYMVDISDKLKEIRELVDEGAYFVINRARQYGKTTTLHALAKALADDYFVVRLDFQVLGSASYRDENTFSRAFASCFVEAAGVYDESRVEKYPSIEKLHNAEQAEKSDFDLRRLFRLLRELCENVEKPVVLMIDEIDSAQNYQVFLDFLAQLRNYYLERESIGTPTFQSVILAGVYDIKNLKSKFVEEHKMNSPWNIATDFDVDLSLTENGIAGMLADYEHDYHTGMDIPELAGLLYDYTSGYPFLVSRICKLMDEKVDGNAPDRSKAWTKEGFLTAVRMLLTEENTLFDSLDNKLIDYPDLKQMLQELLLHGRAIEYIPGDMGIRMASMFGFITIENNVVRVSNRIFETRLYNGFLAERSRYNELAQAAAAEKSQFIVNGQLDMELVIRKFVDYYQEIFGESNETFLENDGRSLFLLYIKPIINGTGNYYIEAQTRTNRRTDVIIDYGGQQYIVELKIFRGQEYHKRGEEQLADYLDLYHAKQGYLVSFNFNKKKKVGVERIRIRDKVILEAVV